MHPLLGKPYAFPSKPPESFDCWTLVKYLRAQQGLPCPLPFKDTEEWCVPGGIAMAVEYARGHWRQVPQPKPYDMAVLCREHVGIVLPGGVLHAFQRNSSVVYTTFPVIRRVWPNAEWWTA